MASQRPKFLSGSQLVIKIVGADTADYTLAYATSLQFQQNMATSGVQVIGAYANQSIEPLAYTASGSFSIMNFVNGADGTTATPTAVLGPQTAAVPKTSTPNSVASANSFLHRTQFMPRQMILSSTFDIDVHMKVGTPQFVTNLTTFLNTSDPTIAAITDPVAKKAAIDAAIATYSTSGAGTLIYSIYDCRLTDWSLSFAPGQLAQERVSFIARGVRLGLLSSAEQAAEASKGLDSALGTAPN